jgi:hypothetical protein
MADDNELKIVLVATAERLKSGMNESVGVIQDSVSRMNQEFGGMGEALSSIASGIKTQFLAMGATIAAAFGAHMVKEFISETAMLSARIETLGVVLEVVGRNAGYTAEQMETIAKGVMSMGITTQEAYQSVIRMTQAQMDLSQASKLARIAQDAAVIGNINSSEAFSRLIMGIQRGEMEILKTIGINVSFEAAHKKLETQLGRTSGQLTEQEKVQARMNGVIEAGARITGAYEASMGTAGKQMLSTARYAEDLKEQIGGLFRPALAEFVKAYNKELQGATQSMKEGKEEANKWAEILGYSAKVVISLYYELEHVAVFVAHVIAAPFEAIGTIIGGVAAAIERLSDTSFKHFGGLVSGDFRGAAVAIKESFKDAMDAVGEHLNDALRSSYETADKIEELWSRDFGGAKKSSGPVTAPPAQKPPPVSYKSLHSDWKAELEQMKVDEDAFFNFDIEREKAFWQDKLKLAKGHKEDYRAVRKELYEIAKKQAKDATDAELAAIKFAQDSDKATWMQKLALEDQKLAALEKLYGKDNQQYRAALLERKKMEEDAGKSALDYRQKTIEAEMKGVEAELRIKEIETRTMAELGVINAKQEIELYRDSENQRYQSELNTLTRIAELWKEYPLKYQEIMDKIKDAQDRHREATTKTEQSLALEQKKKWDSIVSPIKSALDQSVQGIIQGTQTLKQAMSNLCTSILSSFVNFFTQLGLEWLKTQLMLAVMGKAIKSEEVATSVTADAAKGGAGAMASAATTGPWWLAPAIGMAMFGTIMAFKGMASAEKGWDVDQGGLTMIHPREMVLPAPIAEGVRGMTQGGGRQGNVSNFYITAMDGKDVQRVLTRHSAAVGKSIKILHRNYSLSSMARGRG